MDSPVTLLFVALCYAGVLALDALRPYLRARTPAWAPTAVAILGVGLHTAYLGARAFGAAASPLSSPYDWCLLAAWVLAAIYFYLAFYYPTAAVGLFMMPLVLGLIAGSLSADQEPFAPVRASRSWGNAHGVALLLGAVTVMIGFVAGVMYLVQSYRLKHKLAPTVGFRLPSLERLERINSRAILSSVLLIAIGFVSGVMLNVTRQGKDLAHVPWTDPVIVSSSVMLGWLVAASVFALVYRAARKGRKVAYLTLASFVFLAISLFVLVTGDTQHGAAKPDASPPAAGDGR